MIGVHFRLNEALKDRLEEFPRHFFTRAVPTHFRCDVLFHFRNYITYIKYLSNVFVLEHDLHKDWQLRQTLPLSKGRKTEEEVRSLFLPLPPRYSLVDIGKRLRAFLPLILFLNTGSKEPHYLWE